MRTAELNQRIGEIVRMDVFMENQLRHLWLVLVAPSLAEHLAPNDAGRLVEECALMIGKLSLGEAKMAAAKDALSAAKAAHEARNRHVHDMWHLPGEGADWTLNRNPRRGVQGGKQLSVTAADIDKVRDELDRATRRVSTLAMAVRRHLPHFVKSGMAPPPRVDDDDWSFIAGLFEIGPDGGATLNVGTTRATKSRKAAQQ